MTAGFPPSGPQEAGNPEDRITASVVEEAGRKLFKLSFRGETVQLSDAGDLNRWSAIGVTNRHSVALAEDGITIDGQKLLFTDPRATEELETILNIAPQPVHPAAPAPTASPELHHSDAAAARPASNAAIGSAHKFVVTRDGFDFHVTFFTKFGETRTEKLDAALEAFQQMGLLKPHLNLQKVGIRLAVTRWDGQDFVEEAGIADLETATPEDVHALIERCLQGDMEQGAPIASGHNTETKKHVVRLEIVKKSNDFRFHLVFHRNDGSTEEGPLLIRPNLAKLQAEGLFQPNIFVLMTALNDKIIIERTADEGGQRTKHSDSIPLNTIEDAKRAAEALNNYLRKFPESRGAPAAPDRASDRTSLEAKPKASASTAQPAPAPPPIRGAKKTETNVSAQPESRPSQREVTAPHQTRPPIASEKPAPAGLPVSTETESLRPTWMIQALKSVESMSPEQIQNAVFTAFRKAHGRLAVTNEHGFPSVALSCPAKDGSATALELVLMPHYLLCRFPFGYLRFGTETRIFLTRLDDYVYFPQEALRGVAKGPMPGVFVFVVSVEFTNFLKGSSNREYRTQVGSFLVSTADVFSGFDLIWPLSREEQLFQALAATAESFGLPVTPDEVVLDPSRATFLGFKKTSDHGVEFRAGDDFIRFAPGDVELHEGGTTDRLPNHPELVGWALDRDGRVCALYDPKNGFVPPGDIKLMRFLSANERQAEGDGLTLLACLDKA